MNFYPLALQTCKIWAFPEYIRNFQIDTHFFTSAFILRNHADQGQELQYQRALQGVKQMLYICDCILVDTG